MFKLVKKLFSKETIYKLNEFLKDIFFCVQMFDWHTHLCTACTLCLKTHKHHNTQVKARGQLVRLSSLIFSFYYKGPRSQTQVTRLGGKCFSLLSHLASSINNF